MTEERYHPNGGHSTGVGLDTTCVLCTHMVRLHNPASGCTECDCMATQGEARWNRYAPLVPEPIHRTPNLAARQVPEDVDHELVDEQILYAVEVVTEVMKFRTTPEQIVTALRMKGWVPPAALEVSSRPVAPNREALIEWFESTGMVPGQARQMADALLAADLWRPAPVIDRDALAKVLDPVAFTLTADYSHDPRWPAELQSRKDRALAQADALLASGWQPASPRTVTTVEELDALPVGSVIRDGRKFVLERYESGWCNGWRESQLPSANLIYPVLVLYVPSEGVES